LKLNDAVQKLKFLKIDETGACKIHAPTLQHKLPKVFSNKLTKLENIYSYETGRLIINYS